MNLIKTMAMKNRNAWVFITLMLPVLFVPPAMAKEPRLISLGLRTQDWFFMWPKGRSLVVAPGLDASQRLRWQVTLTTLDRYHDWGAEWNLIILHEGEDGPDGFARAKAAVRAYKQRNIQPVFRLIENPVIYSRLRSSPDSQYGYSKTYYKWIRRIAQTFKGDVKIYLIGNEIDSDLSYNLFQPARSKYQGMHVTYEQYSKLLDTAYRAVKDVRPTLQIGDHGVSGFALALAVADGLVHKGRFTDAYRFWADFQFNRPNVLKSTAQLVSLLKNPKMQQRIAVARNSFAQPGKHDYLQLHFYGAWKVLPTILQWIKEQMGTNYTGSKLFASEIGYQRPSKPGTGWDGRPSMVADHGAFSQREQAINMVKDFAILFGNGVSYAEYWFSRSTNSNAVVAPLYAATDKPNLFTPNKAAIAYSVFAQALDGLSVDEVDQVSFPGLTSFTFNGREKISVLWSNNGTIDIPASRFPGLKKVKNLYGKPLSIPASRNINIGVEPIYVYW